MVDKVDREIGAQAQENMAALLPNPFPGVSSTGIFRHIMMR